MVEATEAQFQFSLLTLGKAIKHAPKEERRGQETSPISEEGGDYEEVQLLMI